MKTDYEKQAQDFLAHFGIGFKIKLSDTKAAPWRDEGITPSRCGHHYTVTLTRLFQKEARQIRFDFFGSIADREAGKDPTAYDVLACVSCDVNCPEDFAEFCGEFGYDQDSIRAMRTFKRCAAFGRKLRGFFTTEEIKALQEIR